MLHTAREKIELLYSPVSLLLLDYSTLLLLQLPLLYFKVGSQPLFLILKEKIPHFIKGGHSNQTKSQLTTLTERERYFIKS